MTMGHGRGVGLTVALAVLLVAAGGCSDDGDTQGGAAGAGGSSSLMCVEGTANCNDSLADGCETDLTDDREHCGVCGHNCLEGSCYDGGCQPLVVWSNSEVTSVAVDTAFLYWSTSTRQVLASKKGKSGGALSFNSGNVDTQRPGYLAAAGDTVMFGTSPYLVQMQLGMPGLKVLEPVNVGALGFDGDTAVWWDKDAGAVRWWDMASMQATTKSVAALTAAKAAAVAGTMVYVADAGSIQQINMADDTVTTLLDTGARHIQLAKNSLYMLSDELDGRVLEVPLTGGSSHVFYADSAVTAFAVHRDFLVMATSEGLLLKPLDGGATQLVYRHPEGKPQWPDHSAVAIALDDQRVYWATPKDAGHQVVSVAR